MSPWSPRGASHDSCQAFVSPAGADRANLARGRSLSRSIVHDLRVGARKLARIVRMHEEEPPDRRRNLVRHIPVPGGTGSMIGAHPSGHSPRNCYRWLRSSINFGCELAIRSDSQAPLLNNFNPLPGSNIVKRPGEYRMRALEPELYADGDWFRPFLGFNTIPAANRTYLQQYCNMRLRTQGRLRRPRPRDDPAHPPLVARSTPLTAALAAIHRIHPIQRSGSRRTSYTRLGSRRIRHPAEWITIPPRRHHPGGSTPAPQMDQSKGAAKALANDHCQAHPFLRDDDSSRRLAHLVRDVMHKSNHRKIMSTT